MPITPSTVNSMRPRVSSKAPPPKAPAPPLIGDTGNAKVNAVLDVINQTAAPFQNAPDPARGTLGVVEHGIGAVMGVVGAPFQLLDTGFAMITAPLAALFPGMPAATLNMPHLGPPHGHAHPPSLIPPNPVPVPLPSIGTVMVAGCVSVLIGGTPAARAGDLGLAPTCCGFAPVFDIFTGSSNTWIGGSRAARMTDITWHCNPASAMNRMGKVMGAIGVVAGAVSAGASAAAGQALQAAMQAAQAIADAAALAMGALAGKDPGIPPTIGAIMMGSPTVLIGGFPMPDVLSLLGGIAKALKKIGKAIGKSKGFGKALKKLGLCNSPGEPINPFTGEVYNDFEDYVASDTGLRWERHYRSGWNEQDGPLGYGYRHCFERSLTLLRKRALYATHDNELVALERNDDGTFTPVDGFTLRSQDGYRFELTTDRDETLVYSLRPGSPPTGRLDHYSAPGVDVYLYYDQQDRLSALTEPSARGTVDTHFFYDAAGHITEVHRGLRGQAPVVISRYVYQDGCLVEWHDALGGVKRFRYDGQHRMVQGTDRRGYSFHWEYDPQNGRCIRSYGDDGLWGVQAKYEGAQSVFTEPDGSRWTYKFFPDGTISHLLGPDGGVVQYIRDEETGRIVRQMEPGGKEYTWLYDASGKHFGRLDPYGNLVPPEDDDPNPNSLAHAGPETAKGYLCGRPLAKLAPALAAPPGAVAAQLAAMQAPSQAAGVRSPPARDALDRVVEQYEPDGSVRQFHYDPEGNVVGERLHVPGNGSNGAAPQQGPRGGWLTREYTSWNLLAAETSPLGGTTRYEYTHREKWRAITDPNGNRTEYVRDPRHRIAEIHRLGGVHRRYVYDAHDTVIEEQDGDGNTLVKYETGPNGLHTSCTLSSGECYTYEYDESGQFTQVASSQHQVVQRHAGRKIGIDQRDGKGIYHRYCPALRISRTDYFERFKVHYRYPATRQVQIATPDGSIHTLWHDGRQTIRENGNGTCEALTFDSKERLTARTCWHRDGGHDGPFWATSYRYNAAGELLTRIDTLTGADQYEYDGDHRLVARRNSHGLGQYEYDPAGNLTRTPRHGLIKCGAGNLVEQADFTHFSHDRRYRRARQDDPGGRVVEYHYDSLDQLIEARFSDTGKVWRAAYDGLGRRVWREVDGERTDFYWDDDRLAAERFPDGRLRLYVYPNEDALVPFMWLDYGGEDADPRSGKAYYLFTEPSGMPVRVEDADGIAVWRAAAADPYGELEGKNGAECPTRLRFAGHFYDEELGLFYNRFRDYDPSVGRYLQPDPLGHAGGINLFAYSTNPLVEVDLRGLVHKTKKAKGSGSDDGQSPKKKSSKESDGERPAILKKAEAEAKQRGLVRRESDAGEGFPKGTRKVEYGDPPDAVYHVDKKGRIIRAEGELDPPKKYTKEGVDHVKPDGFVDGQDHRGHLVPERSAATQDHANVRENVIAEHGTESNTSKKKRFENRAKKYSDKNPGTRMVSEPQYEGNNPRPTKVKHTLVDSDGKPIKDPSVKPNPETIPNPDYS